MDNFNYKKYLAEGRLFEEAKTIDVYGDGDVVVDISKATPEQERVINFEFKVSEFSNSEEAQEVVDQIMNLNSAKEVKNYYDNVRGWATVDYLDTYKALNAFVGNKPIAEGKLLKEVMDEEMVDYVSAMYDSDVDQEAEEGFQSDVWSKAQYASNAYNESSIFLELIDHLKSVGGKDVVEGNPDIELELLPNGDIRWSANVTHY